ncbi:MAG: hypothetical protein GF308_14610 [Candidatus Heimdallarchaeota archaeon]|nr:hypothetical protein [Candidatus Heimdallarchaeota archaeon]
MVTWKEDLKYAGQSILFYLLLAAVFICWIAAITLTVLEQSFWVVFGLFLLGTVFFLTIHVLSQEEESSNGKKTRINESSKDDPSLSEQSTNTTEIT